MLVPGVGAAEKGFDKHAAQGAQLPKAVVDSLTNFVNKLIL